MVVKIELLLIHLNQFYFDPVSVEYKTVCPHTQWDIASKDIIFRKGGILQPFSSSCHSFYVTRL